MLTSILKHIDRTRRRWVWERRWNAPDYAPKWELQGVPPELIEAQETGWLPAHGRALDIGCGHGGTTAWLAERGYSATGVDVSRTVVERAQAKHAHLSPRIEFLCKDISSDPLPARHYNVLVDRGCYHGLPARVIPDYVANIRGAAAAEARLLLFIKAFRGGQSSGDEEEARRIAGRIRETFSGFTLERYACTYLNAGAVREGHDPLPGMVFWLTSEFGNREIG